MKATIKTLTPVHIGSGQTLNKNIDFAQEGNQIGFFDLDKIVKLIGIENINQLTSTIEESKPVLDFLRNGRGLKDPLSEFCERTSLVKNVSSSTTQLKEHYRTSLQDVCIPGSSLKGAIKTAIWDSILNNGHLKTLKSEDLKNYRGKWSDTFLDKKLFGKNPNEKTTRFLKIGDIHFPGTSTEIHETVIINQYYNDWREKRGNSFLIECIPDEKVADFNIKIDRVLLSANKKKYPHIFTDSNTEFLRDYANLVELINQYTKAILEWEIGDLEDNYFDDNDEGREMLDEYDKILQMIEKQSENEFILRVGANSGWRFMTGGWITKEELQISSQDYNSLRKVIQRKDYNNNVLLPKTRKTNRIGLPFGFIKVTLQNEQS